jgi:hypothetical protein
MAAPVAAAAAVSAADKKAAIAASIREIPDFPKKGIMFQDVSTLLLDPAAFQYAIDLLVERYRAKDIQCIAGARAGAQEGWPGLGVGSVGRGGRGRRAGQRATGLNHGRPPVMLQRSQLERGGGTGGVPFLRQGRRASSGREHLEPSPQPSAPTPSPRPRL